MRVVLINKSDSIGGAATVSRRLLEALRLDGVDANLLVCEKLTDSPFVSLAASTSSIQYRFLKERLKVYAANGFNRNTLFKIDTGEEGLPLWRHPLVRNADAILLQWVNQGMLSLQGIHKILKMGKPVVWTMHDMWEMTGICHHAASCRHFLHECGDCPLLGKKSSPVDLSYKVWKRKQKIYGKDDYLPDRLAFVAVSKWLRQKAMESSLLKGRRVEVIGNPFNFPTKTYNERSPGKIRLLFGAARLDDPIKGIETLRLALKIFKVKYHHQALNMELRMFGAVKDPTSLLGFDIPLVHLGMLHGEKELEKTYRESHILVSASSYETFGYTLLEAQAYGSIPVSFSQGGQSDIISDGVTGFLAPYSDDEELRACNLAEAIHQACLVVEDENLHRKMLDKMRESASINYSYSTIAKKYLSLIKELRHGPQPD